MAGAEDETTGVVGGRGRGPHRRDRGRFLRSLRRLRSRLRAGWRWVGDRPGGWWWALAACFALGNLMIGNGTLAWDRWQATQREDRDAARIQELEDDLAEQDRQVEENAEEQRCRARFGNEVSDQQGAASILILTGLLAVTEGRDITEAERIEAGRILVDYRAALDAREGSIEACQNGGG